MGRLFSLQQEAAKKVQLANHLVTQTYPLVKDPKLLLVATEYLFQGIDKVMLIALYIERYYNRIPPFKDNFDSRFNAFRYHIVDRYRIDRDYLLLIQDIKTIIEMHKKSPVEFARKDKFVICTDSYRTCEITVDKLKRHIEKAKNFVSTMNNVVSNNEGII